MKRARLGSTFVALLAAVLMAAVAAAVAPLVPAAAAPGTAPTSFTITGSGFGHGVGMPQYGAYGQALAGRTASQIVGWYFSGTTVGAVPDSRELRVNLAHRASSVMLRGEAATATAATAATGIVRLAGLAPVPPAAAPQQGVPVVLPLGTAATVSVRNGGVQAVVTTPAGTVTYAGPSLTVTWSGTRALPGAPTLLDVANPSAGESVADVRGHRYRHGSFEISVVGGALEVVNVVRLHDEYLYGIGEMPSSWPAAALQAQAIASRSYALATAGSLKAACACNVYSGTSSQVYLGWAKEGEPTWGARWVAAVDATASGPDSGLAIVDAAHRVVAGYFSSSSGGRTENNEDVWGGSPVPALRSVDDHWSLLPAVHNSYASWTRSITQPRMGSAFGLPDVATVAVTARTAGGSVATATATSTTGTVAHLSGQTLSARLGLPAAWVSSLVAVGGRVGPPSPPPTTPPPPPARPAPATPVDLPPVNAVYTTPSGAQVVNGRRWRTRCEPYARTATRCFTDIVASRVTATPTGYRVLTDWLQNSITYRDWDSPAWAGSLLATPGDAVSAGRRWRTACSSATGGWRTCRSFIWASLVLRQRTPTGYGYLRTQTWQLVDIVWLKRY